MGTPMAANLVAAGHHVTAHIRHPGRRDELAALGLTVTTDVTGLFDHDLVISMLPDDNSVRDIVFGREDFGAPGLAAILKPGAVHLSMSTISTGAASLVWGEHRRQRQGYVSAPVFGNPDAARARQLFVLAAGAAADVERGQPRSTLSASGPSWLVPNRGRPI
jgi:3-hydroxyisobutyrate dehydrogenase-like beta-hydroxyacid dehydrogenase